mgnify:FL=1
MKIDKETLIIFGSGIGLGILLYYIPPLLRKRRSVIGNTDLTFADISNKTVSKDIKKVNKSIAQIDKFLKEHFNTAIELLFDATNSFVTKDKTLNDLMKKTLEAYKSNNLSELKKLQAKANEYLVNNYKFSFDNCLDFVSKINSVAKQGKFLNFKNENQLYDAMADITSLEMGQVIGTIALEIVETIKSFANDSQVKKALTSLPAKTKLQLYNFLII